MSLLMMVLVTLFAGNSANHSVDPSKYCNQEQFMVTQVGIESTIDGGEAVGGRHRIFSAQDYVNQRFYTNYTLTLVDTDARRLSTVAYELIIDLKNNAHYEIRNGNCKKLHVPEALSSHLTHCLSDNMTHQGSSYVGGFKSSDKALRFDTFTMNLEMDMDDDEADDADSNDGDIIGLTGKLWMTYVENPSAPGKFLQVKEEMIGSVNVPALTSNRISMIFSSDFVDYQDGVDETKFRVPDFCPTEYSQGEADFQSRSRRAVSAGRFRLARYAAVMFAYEI